MRVLKDLMKTGLKKGGFRLVKETLFEQYLNAANDEYLGLYHEANVKANGESGLTHEDFSKERRFYTVYQAIKQVLQRDVPGAFAECGCRYGHSSYIIAKTLEMYNQGAARDFYIFDSFEGGLSDKVDEDRHLLGDTDDVATQKQKQHFASEYESVKRLFADMPNVKITKGWIPEETFVGAVRDQQFAFAHIDVDLYEPTKASCEFFFERMPKGGVIVIDDYGSASFPGCRTAVDEFLAENEHSFFIENHVFGCLIIK